jgi:uncharacterized lipoprotein YmbA
MMREWFPGLRCAVLLALLPLAGGCVGAGTVQPTRLYLLEPLPRPLAAGAAGPTVGVGPVTLPDYADRPQLVTRSAPNELELAPFARWGAPVAEQVAGVLAENLAALLGGDQVRVRSWRVPEELAYRVTVAVERFESDRAGNAVVWARWSVLRRGGAEAVANRRSDIAEPAQGSDDASRAAAYSRALQTLSREIAAVIEQDTR